MDGRETSRVAAIALAVLFGGCNEPQDGFDAQSNCAGGKCDEADTEAGEDGTPESRDSDPHSACEGSTSTGETESDSDSEGDGEAAADWDPDEVAPQCDARKREAFSANGSSFERDFLRWSCDDVDGRKPTERGQEYCEYFAIVQLPGKGGSLGEPHVLGINKGEDLEDGQSPFGLELTDEERGRLDADPEQVVGQCVFTSWNADIDVEELPDREIQGEPLSADVFRMKYFANTNSAAQCLIEECMEYLPPHEEVADYDVDLDDDFTRGCFLNSFINETHDRKSDSVICNSAMRLAECGCGVTTGAAFGEALAPSDVLGFRLGSWDDANETFGACEFQDLGNGEHNLVTCPVTAHQLLGSHGEVKDFCRTQYADEVVVHVDVAAQAVLCSPDYENEQYASTCSDTPWKIEEK